MITAFLACALAVSGVLQNYMTPATGIHYTFYVENVTDKTIFARGFLIRPVVGRDERDAPILGAAVEFPLDAPVGVAAHQDQTILLDSKRDLEVGETRPECL